ncbi:MAG: triphosphoribosyl-dephospho-CoA synthase [Enterobacteriaceae bacterium]
MQDSAQQAAQWAYSALLEEVSAAPKPGLVCPQHSGAHSDMDYHTFVASSTALKPYFYHTASIGRDYCHLLPTEVMPLLRQAGLQGEAEMLAATGGVNTHKGLIFALGLLTAAYARLVRLQATPPQPAGVARAAALFVPGLVAETLWPLKQTLPVRPLTAGEQLFLRYGEAGIRGEAEAGFPSALAALQILRRVSQTHSPALALPQTLLYLMARTRDTNVLWRADMQGLLYVQSMAQQALALGGVLTSAGRHFTLRMQEEFVLRNISPGGCADLLAIAAFLLKLPVAASQSDRARVH